MLSVFKKSFFGPVTKEENKTLKDLNGRETWTLVPLVLIVIWLGVHPKPILGPIDNSVKAMLNFMDEKAITQEAKDMIKVAKSAKEVK
jgi:NADH-quinone oxidoreductase subunit M